jgi:hypothetical protein
MRGGVSVGAVRSPWRRAQQKAARMQLLVAAAGADFARAQSMRAVRGADPHTLAPARFNDNDEGSMDSALGQDAHAATRQHPCESLSIIHAPNCGWCALATMTVCTRLDKGSNREREREHFSLTAGVCHVAKFLGETRRS